MAILFFFFLNFCKKKKRIGFYKLLFCFFLFQLYSPHSHRDSTHFHPNFPRSHPDSPHSHPIFHIPCTPTNHNSPHSHSDSLHSYPYSLYSHYHSLHSPHFVPRSPFRLLQIAFKHQVRCYHISIVKIIAENVSLMQMSKQNRKVLHHDGEQLTFYQKVLHIKTHRLRKEECFCIYIAINSNLLDENCTQDKVKCHIQYERS